MIEMGNKPDWKCVFTYIQSLYKHFVMMPQAIAARAAATQAGGPQKPDSFIYPILLKNKRRFFYDIKQAQALFGLIFSKR